MTTIQSPTIVCRRATGDDIDIVVDILSRIQSEVGSSVFQLRTGDAAREFVSNVMKSTVVYIAVDGCDCVGIIVASDDRAILNPDCLARTVHCWFVRPDARRIGVGKSLLYCVAEDARRGGIVRYLSVFIDDSQEDSVKIVESIGMKPLERCYFAEV